MTHVIVSTVMDARLQDVWQIVRPFNGLPKWHPAVARSEIEDAREEDAIGCVRSFELHNGAWLRERLCALDDRSHTLSYELLRSPMPVKDYVASMKLSRVTEQPGRTFAVWEARFGCPIEEEPKLIAQIEDVFQQGLRALADMLAPAARQVAKAANDTGGR